MAEVKPNTIEDINILGKRQNVANEIYNAPLPSPSVENKGVGFIDLKKLRIGAGDNSFNSSILGIFLGNEQFSSAPFRVSMAGALVATSATITGSVTATSGAIGGFSIGATTISATNLTLTSGAANTANISCGSGANTAGLGSPNASSDIAIWAGSTFANRATAPFRVEADGSVIATDITATGTIQATGGYIGAASTALGIESAGINVGTTGSIRGGMTAYNTGTGWFIGYSGGTYRLSIGNSSDTSKLLLWDGTNLIVNDSPILNNDIFGDGSDGDITISSNTSLSRDMFYDDLTINSGVTLDTAGYRIFVKGVLTVNGTLERTPNNGGNGGDASGATGGTAGTAGAALADGSLKGALAGVVGVAAVNGVYYSPNVGGSTNGNNGNDGSAGTNIAKSLVSADAVAGANGAAGGNTQVSGGGGGTTSGTGGSAGSGGAGGTRTGTVYNQIRSALSAYLLYDTLPSADNLKGAPSNGGSASGGTGSASKGPTGFSESGSVNSGGGGGSWGGGSQGGIVTIFARRIVIGASGIIRANGGNGGNGGNGANGSVPGSGTMSYAAGGSAGGPGGDAGNGGVLIYVYSSLSNSGTIQAAAGLAGSGGARGLAATFTGSLGATPTAAESSNGASGTTANAGVVIALQV